MNGGASNYGAVYKIDAVGHEKVLYSFAGLYAVGGASPYAGVILDSEGNLYGTTPGSGYYNAGVVYKVDTKGQETVLYHLCQLNDCADGETPSSGVVRDSAGNLYGVTSRGGASNVGVVYKIDPTGVETVLYRFTGGADGSGPNSLIRDEAGNLFGTTASGGSGRQGVVFKVDTAGQESVVYYFGPGDGETPVGVTRDAAGNLYGATTSGGYPANAGTVFKIYASGIERNLYAFKGESDGGNPAAGVVLDAAGNLYGTTTHGGSGNAGVVYKVDPAGQETVIYAFNGTGGSLPVSGVVLDAEGNLYGTTPSPSLGVVYKIDTAGQETVLTDFMPTAPPDGAYPSGTLTMSAGELYGVTSEGGAAAYGTVYKLDNSGRETVLYDFVGGANGDYPSGNVTFDTAGNIYGTAGGGSAGQGIVFKLDPAGEESVLYSFTGGTDGGTPSSVVLDNEGNLYGTASTGGFGHGVIFKIDTTGHETVLHNFGGDTFGDDPAGVTRDAAGNLYGTTYYGGVANVGIVYMLDAARRFTILHSFTGGADGAIPNAGLILDSEGNLYGTAQGGGASGVGVVFKLDSAGDETVLYNFCSQVNCTDGAIPSTGVVRDAAGNLYGTTSNEYGYNFGPGQVYMLDASGQETVLWTFTGLAIPNGVIRDPAGNLFGTSGYGGTKSGGLAFKIIP